ncbi:MAG: helix-turn-helix transcriptional regulator [Clostridia bacterium]|nr:helix-turn-helix transcriptional regulator [Clostridia bacterium]
MLEKWIGDAIARMKVNGIRQKDVAREMGVAENYLSMILNGKRNPARGRAAVEDAIEVLIARKEA